MCDTNIYMEQLSSLQDAGDSQARGWQQQQQHAQQEEEEEGGGGQLQMLVATQ